jgi:hypothetical protein
VSERIRSEALVENTAPRFQHVPHVPLYRIERSLKTACNQLVLVTCPFQACFLVSCVEVLILHPMFFFNTPALVEFLNRTITDGWH